MLINYGVRQDNCHGAFEICLIDVFESFLSGRVPDLKLYLGVSDWDDFVFEVHSNCRHVIGLKLVITEAAKDIGLADPTITHNHYFDCIICVISFFVWLHWIIIILDQSKNGKVVENLQKQSLIKSSAAGRSVDTGVKQVVGSAWDRRRYLVL